MSERGLPPQVLTEIDSPIRETRLTGVDELARLAYGADLAMAAAARFALGRLTRDDSRSVAAAAAAALERTAVRLNPDHVDFGQVPQGTQQMVTDVFVEGPPLALATATVTVSGPGLRAILNGRQLRVMWLPESLWLDGLITVRGPAGWADVAVTGQITDGAPAPMQRAPVEARLRDVDRDRDHERVRDQERVGARTGAGVGAGNAHMARVAVLPPPPKPPSRRRARVTVLVASVVTLVVLGGVGVAVAMASGERRDRPPSAALIPPPPTTVPTPAAATPAPVAPATVAPVPLARRVASIGKPTVIGTIRVGTEPEGVVVAPDGRTVYVANQNSHVLSVVDTVSRRVTAVTLRNTPRFVAISRDGGLVFVSMYETNMSGSGVAVVDTATNRVTRYLTTGMQPYALAVAPDGQVWVPIHSQHRVEIYSAGNQRPAGRIEVPPNPHAAGFSASLMRAFTPNHESNAVAVIDMRTDKVLKSIPVSQAPHSLAVSPDGKTVVVAGYEANKADLIDAVTLRRTGTVPVGRQPQSVAYATDGGHAYVVNEGDNTLSVLNGHTGAVTATIKVGKSPRTVAVSPDGLMAYVSNGDDNTISMVQVGQ
jgi:YVTN family beta-propeller protein